MLKKYKDVWIVYFDILGFKNLISESDENDLILTNIIEDYYEILNKIKNKKKEYKDIKLGFSWFSDTFLIYSETSEIENYVIMQQIITIMIEQLIYKRIPVRGSISFGKMYINEDDKIFIGPALVEAYEYGEDQNWINISITPSAKIEIIKSGLNPLHHNFTSEESCFRKLNSANTYAYTFCRGGSNSDSPLIPVLEEMSCNLSAVVKSKYNNTIELIKKYRKKL